MCESVFLFTELEWIAVEHLSTTKLILAAVAALLIGVMIYMVDRQADVYFLSGLLAGAVTNWQILSLIGVFAGWWSLLRLARIF